MIKLSALILASAALAFGQAKPATVDPPKAPELTMEQKLAFETSLKDFYLQAAITNNLRASLANQQANQEEVRKKIFAACPGEVVGLETDKAECRLKSTTTTAAAPAADKPAAPSPNTKSSK